MKSNFFKIVLPAFALMIAIMASLAFTSNSSDANVTVFIKPNCQEAIIDESKLIGCSIYDGIPCTITILATVYDIYGASPCTETNLLRKP